MHLEYVGLKWPQWNTQNCTFKEIISRIYFLHRFIRWWNSYGRHHPTIRGQHPGYQEISDSFPIKNSKRPLRKTEDPLQEMWGLYLGRLWCLQLLSVCKFWSPSSIVYGQMGTWFSLQNCIGSFKNNKSVFPLFSMLAL